MMTTSVRKMRGIFDLRLGLEIRDAEGENLMNIFFLISQYVIKHRPTNDPQTTHKSTHKSTHKTTHKSTHKTTHKTTHKSTHKSTHKTTHKIDQHALFCFCFRFDSQPLLLDDKEARFQKKTHDQEEIEKGRVG
jgi:hypothetical protein